MPRGIPGSGPKKQTTETLSISDAIKRLIEGLGHDLNDVAAVEIRSTGVVRVIGTDRGLRSHRIEWPTAEEASDA